MDHAPRRGFHGETAESSAGPRDGAHATEPRHEDVATTRMSRLHHWQVRLLSAVRMTDLLELLHEFGLRDDDIAAAVPDISARTARRWRQEGTPHAKAPTRWSQVDDLRSIIGFMLADGTYDEAAIIAWLRSRQQKLGLQRPLDVLRAGRFDDVLTAAEMAVAPRAPAGSELLSAPPSAAVDEGHRGRRQ